MVRGVLCCVGDQGNGFSRLVAIGSQWLVQRLFKEQLTAWPSTLGVDSGVGMAAALALLALPADAKLPLLECLFTVKQDNGVSGAWGGMVCESAGSDVRVEGTIHELPVTFAGVLRLNGL